MDDRIDPVTVRESLLYRFQQHHACPFSRNDAGGSPVKQMELPGCIQNSALIKNSMGLIGR
ncbi:hypothetical protein CJP46_07610 [Paenibacillus sp. XY044]|nr:hypothetical protein CJP46_07610 [Paenibacillus sp. XY044]